MGQPQEAIAALLQGEAADSNNSTIPSARATIHAHLGEKNEALSTTARPPPAAPGLPGAMQLIQALSRPSR